MGIWILVIEIYLKFGISEQMLDVQVISFPDQASATE